jgi:hypothetical protein
MNYWGYSLEERRPTVMATHERLGLGLGGQQWEWKEEIHLNRKNQDNLLTGCLKSENYSCR